MNEDGSEFSLFTSSFHQELNGSKIFGFIANMHAYIFYHMKQTVW